MNHFTETNTTSYGKNIGNSFKGILFGVVLIIGSIILLSYNENRSINQTLALEEMQSKIVTLPNSNYDAKYEKKPVLVYGEVKPIKPLEDTLFGVKSNGLVLKRNVQMYQWKEKTSSTTEEKLGGSTETKTTYDYVKVWSSIAINSSSFKYPQGHHNPPMTYSGATYITDAKMGEFYLSTTVINHFNTTKSFNGLSNMPEKVGELTNYKSFLYKGVDPNNPEIGDIKITYSEVPRGAYTIVGMEQGRALVPYKTENGKSLLFVRGGQVSADQIFQEEFDLNSMITWLLRGLGLLLMFIGFMLIMGPLSTLAKVIPMLGSLVAGAASIVAAILTLIVGSLVIAIAWFAVRPLLSLILIVVGFGLAVVIRKFKKGQTPPIRAGATPPPRRR